MRMPLPRILLIGVTVWTFGGCASPDGTDDNQACAEAKDREQASAGEQAQEVISRSISTFELALADGLRPHRQEIRTLLRDLRSQERDLELAFDRPCV